ncbi:MAG: hypothetical protein JSV04_15035 [Candidatus Heimdallarchaeota archaeon]|nr:MAG: hypothetical protein JSV04_15035 [Candidatus Heimdallarchaeota archaeon]
METSNYQAGCVLQLGKESLCYSQDARPLMKKDGYFFCPLMNFTLSEETYQEINRVITPILAIQDEESTGINIWPLLTGMSATKHIATTIKGKEMVSLSKKVLYELEEIVFGLSNN